MIQQIREEFVDMMFLLKQGPVRLLFNIKKGSIDTELLLAIGHPEVHRVKFLS